MDGMSVTLASLASSGWTEMPLTKETVSSAKRRFLAASDARTRTSVISA